MMRRIHPIYGVVFLCALVSGAPWGGYPPQQQQQQQQLGGMGFGGMEGNPDGGISNLMQGGQSLADLLGGYSQEPQQPQRQQLQQHRHMSNFAGDMGGRGGAEMGGRGVRGEAGEGRLDVQVTQRSNNCQEKAKSGDKIAMHYTGRLKSNGKVFDSSLQRGEPLEFTLGAGEVIKGWDKGILGMCVGERRRLTIPPALAYGDEGMGPIPAHSTLVFDIKLVNIKHVGGMDAADPLNYFKMMGAMGKKK